MRPQQRSTLTGFQLPLLLAVLGLGLIVAAAAVLHTAAGLAAAGLACLILEWRVSE